MGYLRFSLIVAVIYYHLAGKDIAGPAAVYGFFLLSGYVITLVSSEIYGGGWRGRGFFLANRVARVWPTYLVCLVISLLCMQATGFTTGLYQREFTLPTTPLSWLVQLSIVGQSNLEGRWPQRILPPAWSLSTEICYYLIIGLLTGKSRRLTGMAFGLSALAAACMLYAGAPWQLFYFSMGGPAVIFFTGGMFYHYRHIFKGMMLRHTWLLVMLANLVIYAPDMLGLPGHYVPVLYVTSFYLGYIVMCLHMASLKKKPSRLDQFLADVTYPMFLLHWAVGALVCFFGLGEYQRNPGVFTLALLPTMAISAAVVFAVEMPVKKLRRHFRERAIPSGPP